MALASAGLALAVRGARGGLPVRVILLVAVCLKVLLWPLPFSLSDDALRYEWDGRVTVAGENPYALEPDAAALAPLRDELWVRLPHRDVATVYPPLAIAFFSIAAVSPSAAVALKVGLSAFDLGTCVLLLSLARRRGIPSANVLWYAWNPLVNLETAGMAHVDAMGVFFCVLAVWALDRRRARGDSSAGWTVTLAAAAGVLVKIVPVLAWPAWLGRGRGAAVRVGAAVLVVAAIWLPFWVDAGGVPPGLVTYGTSWEFNGPLYEPLWRGLEALGTRAGGEAVLDRLKEWTGRHEAINRIYPWNYARLHAKLLLGVALLVAAWAARRRADPVDASGAVFGAMVLASATVYPWYLLWVLPWASLRAHPAWLTAAAVMPWVYLPALGGPPLWPWVFLGVWAPFWLLMRKRERWSFG